MDDGKSRNRPIHRLVGNAFIPNPDNLPEIHHKNYIKSCNYLWNLEWKTGSGNVKDAYETGRKSNACENHPHTKFSNSDVIRMRKLHANGTPILDLTERYNAKYCTIWRIIKRINFSSI